MSDMSLTPSSDAEGIRVRRLVGTIIGNLKFIVAASFRPSAQVCWKVGGRDIHHIPISHFPRPLPLCKQNIADVAIHGKYYETENEIYSPHAYSITHLPCWVCLARSIS